MHDVQQAVEGELSLRPVRPSWSPQRRLQLIEEMQSRTGSASESLFDAHGLAEAYRSPGRGSSKRARINAALYAAEQRGDLTAILDAAAALFLSEPEGNTESHDTSFAGATQMTSTSKLFVSHASADKALAELLRKTLVLGGVPNERIFFSSMRGTGIPAGQDVGAYLRESLHEAGLVIELISVTFLTRPMCLMELGGAWTMGKSMYPIVVPPLTRKEAVESIGNIQMGLLGDSEDDLNDIFDELHGRLAEIGLQVRNSDWNPAIRYFKEQLATQLAAVQAAATSESTVRAGAMSAPKSPIPKISSTVVSFDGNPEDGIDITNISLGQGRRGRREIHAEATNLDTSDHTLTVKATFYDSDGAIIGTSSAVVSQLRVGATKTFSITDVPEYARGKLAVDTILDI